MGICWFSVFPVYNREPFFPTEEEEEEEIAQPQPVVETPTEKPDQKEEEEGTPLPVIKYNSDIVTHFSSSRHFTITYTIVEWLQRGSCSFKAVDNLHHNGHELQVLSWYLTVFNVFIAAPHELTEEEKLQILHSEEFVNFFEHSTRIIERALSEHVDLFFDYSGRDLEEKEG